MAEHNQTGQKGEQIAIDFLRNQGYRILESNWRFKHEEVDAICEDKNELVFVEVKTRSSLEHGDPTDAITQKKMGHLIDAAEEYVTSRNLDMESRFDVITVVMDSPPTIEHIKDAFGPEF